MAKALRVEVIGDTRSYANSLRTASGETESFGRTLGHLAKAALALGVAYVSLDAIKNVVGAAVDAQEANDKLTVAFQNQKIAMEATSPAVLELEKASRSLGFTNADTREGLLKLVNSGKTYAQSVDEMKVAQDLARVSGKSLGDSTTDLIRLQAGNTRAAKQYGIVLPPLTVAQDKLKASKIDLTTAEGKHLMALAKVQDKLATGRSYYDALTKKVQGQGDAFSKTAAGGMARFHSQLQNLEENLGGVFLPVLGTVAGALGDFIGKLTAAPTFTAKVKVVFTAAKDSFEAIKKALSDALFGGADSGMKKGMSDFQMDPGIIAKIRDGFAALDWASVGKSIIDGITAALQGAADLAKTLAGNISSAISSIDWVSVGRVMGPGLAAAVTVAFTTLLDPTFWVKNWDLALSVALVAFSGPIGKIGGKLALMFKVPIEDAMLATAGVMERLSPKLAEAFLTGLQRLPSLIAAVGARLVGPLEALFSRLGRIAQFTIKVLGVQAAINAAVDAGKAIVSAINRGLTGLVNTVADWFRRLWAWIKGAVGTAYAMAYSVAEGLGRGLFDGLKNLAGKVTGAIHQYITGPIGSALHSIPGFSPPVDAGRWLGRELVRGITESLKQGQGAVSTATTSLTSTIGKGAIKGMGNATAAIIKAAKKFGVDVRAALAVAMTEGGTSFGAVGDSGTSFGPFQMHLGGALGNMDPAKAREFANSIAGITAAIRMMAQAGAQGKTGFDAIAAIVRNFERPADPSGEIQKALAFYKQIPGAIGGGLSQGAKAAAAQVRATLTGMVNLVKEFGPKIGAEHVRGIIAGLVQSQPTLVQQARAGILAFIAAQKQAVAEGRQGVIDAFKTLATDALSAFDAVAAAWVPPAQKLLNKMQLEDQIKAATQAVADAQAQVDAAVAAQQALTQNAGESDADFAARQAQAQTDVETAVKALGAAQRAFTEFELGLNAAQQQAAHDRQMAADREHFAAQLAQLEAYLAKHPEAYARVQKQIIALLKKYHVPMFKAGQELASRFADGLADGLDKVIEEARRLANAIENITGSSGSGGGAGGPQRPPDVGQSVTLVTKIQLDGREVAQSVQKHLVRYGVSNAVNPVGAY